ncbi:ABC transporter substrate-binding protein [Inquilinus limosus]|uniref:Iron ABC transporter substrate-binding protein n=1 Tax=Inquilinus limosus MP06 TaxID=1398085 RepID=A0A0A0DCD1_9PROT|nr:extracellular solute-binding protein [Inquilinus limosus]KGM35680.1 iron ABC transporter substrate-binding protein [Inquilinus limosus MP06]
MSNARIAAVTLFVAIGCSGPGWAAAPEPYQVTPDLVAAATKEGTVVYYTSTDVQVAEKLGAAFEAKYPGLKVQVERAGSERVFQRIGQEYSAGIHNADVIETSDASNFLTLKDQSWLTPAVPEDVAKLWGADDKDPDGQYAAFRATLTVMAYRTDLVKPEDVPKTWTDLLDPKYKGKLVKSHPGYSGNVMTATYALSQLLGFDYFEKLGHQEVMQVQSSTEPPKVLSQGERPIQADGNEYNVFILQDRGVPIKPIYPPEGTSIAFGNAAILAYPPHPNAAKLFYSFMFSQQAQQLNVDVGGLRSVRPDVTEKAGRTPLSQIKLIESDPADVRDAIEDIKQKYEEYFGT